MKIVMLDRNSIGFDIDVDLFAKLGDFTYHNIKPLFGVVFSWMEDMAVP